MDNSYSLIVSKFHGLWTRIYERYEYSCKKFSFSKISYILKRLRSCFKSNFTRISVWSLLNLKKTLVSFLLITFTLTLFVYNVYNEKKSHGEELVLPIVFCATINLCWFVFQLSLSCMEKEWREREREEKLFEYYKGQFKKGGGGVGETLEKLNSTSIHSGTKF